MKLEKLQLPVVNGGLAVPNFQYYHWSIQLKSDWVAQDPKSMWLDLESQGCNSLLLSSVPFLNNIKHLSSIQNNFIVSSILSTWNCLKKAFSITSKYSFYAANVNNPNFTPCIDPGFKEWNRFGIQVINDLYKDKL